MIAQKAYVIFVKHPTNTSYNYALSCFLLNLLNRFFLYYVLYVYSGKQETPFLKSKNDIYYYALL